MKLAFFNGSDIVSILKPYSLSTIALMSVREISLERARMKRVHESGAKP